MDEKIEIIGVKFKPVGKIYYFDPLHFSVERGETVIVETARGIEYGFVELANRKIDSCEVSFPLKPIIRIGTLEDKAIYESNKESEKNAMETCIKKAKKHNLEMKLIDVEYTFDKSKLLFYFTAEGRIDFRDLVKDLAAIFRTRIELRQIGVRDEAKILNGIGICGRTLCCATFLGDFQPVSIKMAKEQSLSLNPTKISGICGRLMCCLKYEEEAYEELKKSLPNIGDFVSTEDGSGEVLSVNTLRQLVKVAVKKNNGNDTELNYYHVNDITVLKSRKYKAENTEIPKNLSALLDE